MVRILTDKTEKLNLESHYWLSSQFLSKLGTIAPNLTELSLRRMDNISNVAFADMFKTMKSLVTIDLSNCSGLHSTALQLLLQQNKGLRDLQLNSCSNAVDDVSMRFISNLEDLTFLDCSFAKKLTDEGLLHFKDKTRKIQTLCMNGCPEITYVGLNEILKSSSTTLMTVELAIND